MSHYVHFIVGFPAELSAQLKQSLSPSKVTGPKGNPYRVFVRIPRPSPTIDPQSWASNIYTQFRNYLLQVSNDTNEIPLSEISGAHIHLYYKNLEEKEYFLTQFGVETFVSMTEYSRQNWSLHATKEKGKRLAREVHDRALDAERIIKAIKTQLQTAQNKTPLLLPFGNFDESQMQTLRDDVFSVNTRGDTSNNVKDKVIKFNHLNRKHAHFNGDNHVYRNKRNIYFSPPGKNLHAKSVAELIKGHEEYCWVRGTLRFGAPFYPRFHYDCEHRKVSVLKKLQSCHGQEGKRLPKKRAHVNIAPNDNLR